MTDDLLTRMHEAVLDGEGEEAARLAQAWLDAGQAALDAIDGGLTPALREAGQLFEDGDFFLPELVTAARAMQAATAVLRPSLVAAGGGGARGRVVLGTVHGDIHEIGKSLVGMMLVAAGFDVEDLGVDVPVERFVATARAVDADLVGASALLTTTMSVQRDLVTAVREAGLRARVLVGGAPTDPAWAEAIGADGWAGSAAEAVQVAEGLMR
jgi:trimethylamine corrinoid protein